MSLDTLFTEAAEAGGPPRFTEDDIARRVTGRRRRRRHLATGAAALVVLACGAVGVALANQGGTGSDDAPATPGTEIPAVPITPEALVGEWRIRPTGTLDFLEELTFAADGTFSFTGGCNSTGGTWTVLSEELVLHGEGVSQVLCGGSPEDPSMLADDLFTQDGVSTLYEDGLLRVVDEHVTADLVRADDDTPPDPAFPRAEAAHPVPITEEAVLGSWFVDGSDGPSLTFETGGTFTFEDCNDGHGRWSLTDGQIAFDSTVVTTANPCPAPVLPYLQAVLDGPPLLTSTGSLILRDPVSALVLHREGSETAEPAPTVELTGTRWVRAPEEVDSVPQASSIDFGEDGYRMATTCGTVDGTYGVDGSQVTMTLTSSDLGPACDVFYPDTEVDHAVLDGERLTIHLAETAGMPDNVDLTRAYVPLDSLAAPTSDQLVGTWGSPLDAEVMPAPLGTFSADGTVTFGGCASPASDWSLEGGRLRIDVPDESCALDYGFDPGPNELDVRLSGDVLYLAGEEHVAIARRAADDAEQVLADAFAAMGVEVCCGEPAHGSPVATSGFVHEGVEMSVVAGPTGSVDGFIRYTGVEAVLDGRATFSQADGWIMVGFACGDLVVALSPYVPDGALDPAVIVAAAERLIDALPCEAQAVGLP